MINIYDNLRDNNDALIPHRTILFVKTSELEDDGGITTYSSGIGTAVDGSGAAFIVDDWVIEQVDKLKISDGILSIKDGEELIPPVKSEKQLQIEAIERQLAALRAEPDEPANNEEQSEKPAE